MDATEATEARHEQAQPPPIDFNGTGYVGQLSRLRARAALLATMLNACDAELGHMLRAIGGGYTSPHMDADLIDRVQRVSRSSHLVTHRDLNRQSSPNPLA